MLYKINTLMYPNFISDANAHECGSVYPLSVAEGIQEGDIYTNSREDRSSVLFWAHCGFAYISGNCDKQFLLEIESLMQNQSKPASKRFRLMTNDESTKQYFRQNENVSFEKRYLFEYSKNRNLAEPTIPDGYKLIEIDKEILLKISGNILPQLFWKDLNGFLTKGKGYCITYNDDIASWAFTAAVSNKEIDIGIETNPKYQHQGLGGVAAKKMIEYTIKQEKKPVWACHYKNTASEKLAEKLGFVKVSECSVLKSKK